MAVWKTGAWHDQAWFGTAWEVSAGSAGDDTFGDLTNTKGSRKTIFIITDLTGLKKWVDYLPVQVVSPSTGKAGRYDDDKCLAVRVLGSATGKVAWVDYIPCAVTVGGRRWSYDDDGFLPVDTVTPS